jgi:hypothetical protein
MKYVPILKWKAAELTSLTKTNPDHRKEVVPLAEIVLPSINTLDKATGTRKSDEQIHQEMVLKLTQQRVLEVPEEFETAWKSGAIYLDVTLIHDEERTTELKCFTLKTIAEGCQAKDLKIIPVVNIADASEIITTVRELIRSTKTGEVCIRVTSSGLKDISILNNKLAQILVDLGTTHDKVHLLIDLKYLESSAVDYKSLFDQAQLIQNLADYKEFIFAAGAFPVDMSKFNSDNNPCLTSRLDWKEWCENVSKEGLVRKPTYSDYTIRHPHYSESLQFMEATSTLKYTAKLEWMIFKGQKRNFGAYLANASVLVDLPEFKDSTDSRLGAFSYGDQYIVDKANHFPKYAADQSVKGTGRNQDWIAAGINHHTALVIQQLSNLGG